MKQGQLLYTLNRLEGAADRFAQTYDCPKMSLEWVEAQSIDEYTTSRQIQMVTCKSMRFGQTQRNTDVHHMAYATYVAGLLLVQMRLKMLLFDCRLRKP